MAKILDFAQNQLFVTFSILCQKLKTSRERPKSAPYLRLKNTKGLQNVKVRLQKIEGGPFGEKNFKKVSQNLKYSKGVSSGPVEYFYVKILLRKLRIVRN